MLPPTKTGRIRHLAELYRDEEGAFAMLYAAVFLIVLALVGAAVDYSYEVQIRYQLDLAADAASIAAAQAWQETMEAGAATATTSALFDTLKANAALAAQTAGKHAFNAQAGSLAQSFGSTPPTIDVGNITVTPSTPNAGTDVGASVTVQVNYTTSVKTFFVSLAPISTTTVPVATLSTSQVQIGPYVQVYIVMDTSVSMTVGSSPSDIYKVVQWVQSNPTNILTNGTTGPCAYACHDVADPPSSSDVAYGETNAHAAGALTRLDVAKLALINDPSNVYNTYNSSFGEGLLPYIRDKYDNAKSTVNLSTFVYNLYGFNNDIGNSTDGSQPSVTGIANSNKAALASSITNITPGVMTHLNWTVLPKLALSNGLIGASGNGATAATAIKFVILMTDGVTSNRDWDAVGGPANVIQAYNANNNTNISTRTGLCSMWNNATIPIYPSGLNQSGINICAPTPASACTTGTSLACGTDLTKTVYPGYPFPAPPNRFYGTGWLPWPGTATVGIQAPLDTYLTKDASGQYTVQNSLGYCATMKNNNVSFAVLETPYVTLNGESPSWFSYEENVMASIYPNGQNTGSVMSAGLKACATKPSYYYQATSDAAIATGFQQLFDNFVGQYTHITH
jgi:Flp pilus assembly protein TadG